MQPCINEQTIKEIKHDIDKLKLSDIRKEEQISNLIKSVDSLIGWIKIFVGTTLTTLIALVGFLINYWVKG